MIKKTTHINCPKEWESTNDWDSHRPLLFLSLENSGDKIWEFGCGYGSTPIINEYCIKKEKGFGSIDNNKEWTDKFSSSQCVPFEDVEHYLPASLLLVDCAPAELRKVFIGKYANDFDVILVHDTEPSAEYVYGMSDVLSTFKYRLDYQPEGMPHTTAVSNFIDVTQWV